MIPLSEPHLNGREWQYLKECLDTNWVSSAGPFVDRLEQAIARTLDVPAAVALASGTAALHLALLQSGAGPGDYVIVSDLTFVAPVNAIRYVGASPILVDADPDTWQLDVPLLAERLATETEMREQGCYWKPGKGYIRALLPVHILGGVADVAALRELSQQYHIPLIEDASEALGASFDGKAAGSWGTMGALSFNGNKIITSGGGGMLLCQDERQAVAVRHLSTQARTDAYLYAHDQIGYNYRLSNLHAAIGLAQWEQLPDFLARRRAHARQYRALLKGCVRFQAHLPRSQPNEWLCSVRVADKMSTMHRLHNAGIDCRSIWTPMHLLPMYQDVPYWENDRQSEQIFASCLSLPSSAQLTEAEIAQVCSHLQEP